MKSYYTGVIKLANRWETSKSKKQIFKHDKSKTINQKQILQKKKTLSRNTGLFFFAKITGSIMRKEKFIL